VKIGTKDTWRYWLHQNSQGSWNRIFWSEMWGPQEQISGKFQVGGYFDLWWL